jgi:hypothetical protein
MSTEQLRSTPQLMSTPQKRDKPEPQTAPFRLSLQKLIVLDILVRASGGRNHQGDMTTRWFEGFRQTSDSPEQADRTIRRGR